MRCCLFQDKGLIECSAVCGYQETAGRTFKVGQMQHARLLHPVVLATLKEGVVQVRQVRHDALVLGLAKQGVVPLTQPVAAGRLLPVGVAVQDVVITLKVSTTC